MGRYRLLRRLILIYAGVLLVFSQPLAYASGSWWGALGGLGQGVSDIAQQQRQLEQQKELLRYQYELELQRQHLEESRRQAEEESRRREEESHRRSIEKARQESASPVTVYDVQLRKDREALEEVASRNAKVLRTYPDWPEIKENPDFWTWIQSQPESTKNMVFSLNANDIINVVRLYKRQSVNKRIEKRN